MFLEATLDRVHARVVADPRVRLFTAATRGMLAGGFIPPALVKFGGRFGSAPGTPAGDFFQALFAARGFYLFVAGVQLLAPVLLLFRATAALGAVLYFPVILTIFVITIAFRFPNTAFVTGAMPLASAYLLGWNYDRWKALLPGFGPPLARPDPARDYGVGGTALAGGAGLAALGAGVLGVIDLRDGRPPAVAGALLPLAGALAWAVARRYQCGRPAEGRPGEGG